MVDQKPKAAGIAALIAAATFVFGIVMFATVVTDYITGDPTPEESVAFVVDHQAGLAIAAGMVSNIAIGTVTDLNDTDPAAAETVWSALDSVQNGLGGGNEIAGGVWILLVS